MGYHNAQIFLGDTADMDDWKFQGKPEDYPEDRWPAKCQHCEEVRPDNAARQVFRKRLYNTKSGLPEPGDLYWADWYQRMGENSKGEGTCTFHDNCDGWHLRAIVPNGGEWDIDGRASNCTLPKDRLHRCWVRTGEPPNVTVGKAGVTCNAGAGSIAIRDYHGFLFAGVFT